MLLRIGLLSRREPAVQGEVAPGFEGVAEAFRDNFRGGGEIGAALCVYVGGREVVHLWGGLAERETARPWEADTRVVVFSSTKGLAALCLLLLHDRGLLDLEAPVARYWPGFARGGKDRVSVRTLLNHRAGLASLEVPLELSAYAGDLDRVSAAAEAQEPLWTPDAAQGYGAIAWGVFAGELFRHAAQEPLGAFLAREVASPLEAEVSLGAGPALLERVARLYPLTKRGVVARILPELVAGRTLEGRLYRQVLFERDSHPGRAFLSHPRMGPRHIAAFNDPAVLALELPWASAVCSARGLARAYLPLSLGGAAGGRRFVRPETIAPLLARQSWSEEDLVLRKPIGFSQGFCKDELTLFSPNPEAFGHSGMGGSLGLVDPTRELALGYVMNRMDHRVRSPRSVRLCHAVYAALGQPFPGPA